MRTERVEAALALIATVDAASLSLKALVDRIELVSTSPQETRQILDTATRRGLIDRDGAEIAVRDRSTAPAFEPAVVRRVGAYRCRRCGRRLTTGHFIAVGTAEVGPFGATCVDRVLSGRP